MAAVAIGTTIAGTAYSAYSSYQAGKEGKKLSEQEAKFQRDKAKLDEQRLRFDAPRQTGTMRAVLNTQGRKFQEITGLDLIAEAAGEIELDALITRAGGEIKSASALSEGNLLAERGKNQAISTLLSGGSRVASMWPK